MTLLAFLNTTPVYCPVHQPVPPKSPGPVELKLKRKLRRHVRREFARARSDAPLDPKGLSTAGRGGMGLPPGLSWRCRVVIARPQQQL